jgi:hypothetical protein
MLTVVGRTRFTNGANEGMEGSVRSVEGATGASAAAAGEVVDGAVVDGGVVDTGARSSAPRQPGSTTWDASTTPETAMQKMRQGDERERSMWTSSAPS